MKQIEFFEIQNLCIGVCKSGPRGYCMGCFRSREERQFWNGLDDGVKRQIAKACAVRKRRAMAKKRSTEEEEDLPPQQDLF